MSLPLSLESAGIGRNPFADSTGVSSARRIGSESVGPGAATRAGSGELVEPPTTLQGRPSIHLAHGMLRTDCRLHGPCQRPMQPIPRPNSIRQLFPIVPTFHGKSNRRPRGGDAAQSGAAFGCADAALRIGSASSKTSPSGSATQMSCSPHSWFVGCCSGSQSARPGRSHTPSKSSTIMSIRDDPAVAG